MGCEVINYGGAWSKTWNKCGRGARLVNIRGYLQHKIKTRVWDKEKGGARSKTWNNCDKAARLVTIMACSQQKIKTGVRDKEKWGVRSKTWNKCDGGTRLVTIKGCSHHKTKTGVWDKEKGVRKVNCILAQSEIMKGARYNYGGARCKKMVNPSSSNKNRKP